MQLHLFKNGLILESLSGSDLISLYFNATVTAIENTYHLHFFYLLLLFSFLLSLENKYMNHHVYYLFYDIFNTSVQLNKKDHFLSLTFLIFINFFPSLFDVNFILWFLEYYSSSASFEEIKLIAVINWILHLIGILLSCYISLSEWIYTL